MHSHHCIIYKSITVVPSLIQLTALSIPTQASITYMAAKEVWKQEMPSWFPFQLYNLYFSDLRESVNSLRKQMGKKKIKPLSQCHVDTKWELSIQCNQAYAKQFLCLYNRSKNTHLALASQTLICWVFFQQEGLVDFGFTFIETSKDLTGFPLSANPRQTWAEVEGWYFACCCKEETFWFWHSEEKWPEIAKMCQTLAGNAWLGIANKNNTANHFIALSKEKDTFRFEDYFYFTLLKQSFFH